METAAGIWIVSAENCHLSVLYISLSVFLHSVSRERLTCLAHAEWPRFSHVCWLLVQGGCQGGHFHFHRSRTICAGEGEATKGNQGFLIQEKERIAVQKVTTDTHFTLPLHAFYQNLIQQFPGRTFCQQQPEGSRTPEGDDCSENAPRMLGKEPIKSTGDVRLLAWT